VIHMGQVPTVAMSGVRNRRVFGAGDIEMLILLIRKLGMKVVFGMTMIMQMF
jgi:hypothetical protein